MASSAVLEHAGQGTASTFDPLTLASDLRDVCRIYARLFEGLHRSRWDTPVRRGRDEWTLRETIAHLCALNGDGVDSIQHRLRGETYAFRGLDDRYQLNAYNAPGSTLI